MTDLLEKALVTVRGLPPEQQDEIARAMLAFIGDDLSIYHRAPEGAEAQAVDAKHRADVGGA